MRYAAEEIAKILNGTIEGDPTAKVSSFSKIEEGKPGTLSFLANPKYTQYIYSSGASVILIPEGLIPEEPVKATLIRVKDPYIAFAQLLELYTNTRTHPTGIATTASIGRQVTLGTNLYIGEHTVIGNYTQIGDNTQIFPNSTLGESVTIGRNCLIYSGVHIYPHTLIGDSVTIHSGAVIGADGFGFAPQEAEEFKKIAQIGNVVIEDHVEIGANTTIDRATLGSTIIRKGVKLDNLIQVAHNVEIGENTVIASQTGISGSSKIGANCMIGGQVGIAGHLKIGNNVRIAAQAGIGNHVKDNETVMGSPAFAAGNYKKSYVLFRKFPELLQRLENLEKKQQHK
ncbi:MAG: UDP-3-O-(3-hydroxymyristoyl)glucosamine N-acyltransferase [Bacteroidales bacterium]